MNYKQTNTRHLFGNKRSAKEQKIHEHHVKARRSYDAEMDRYEDYIHHLNSDNGIGRKLDVQK